MSLRRPAKNQPETFEFSSSSMEEANKIVFAAFNEVELNSKYSGCSLAGLFKLIYLPHQKQYQEILKWLVHLLTYVL